MAPAPYWEGLKIIPIFVASFYFSYLYLFPVGYEVYYEKTKLMPIATILVATINIILDLILIPRYAAIGAVFATLIAQILLFVFHLDICARVALSAILIKTKPMHSKSRILPVLS